MVPSLLIGDDFNCNVLAHIIHNFFLRALPFVKQDIQDSVDRRLSPVETKLVDDALKMGPAQDFLADDLQAVVNVGGHGRLDEVRWHLLRLDEDRGLRKVGLGQLRNHRHGAARDDQGGNDDPPPPAQEDSPIVAQLSSWSFLHGFK